jgi:hypothetical protein
MAKRASAPRFSDDLLQRVVRGRDRQGWSVRETVEQLGLTDWRVRDVLRRHDTGRPLCADGKHAKVDRATTKLTADAKAWVRLTLENAPRMHSDELALRLYETLPSVFDGPPSEDAINRAVRAMGFTCKKATRVSVSMRAVEREAYWRAITLIFQPSQLIFTDETYVVRHLESLCQLSSRLPQNASTGERLKGRAPEGQRFTVRYLDARGQKVAAIPVMSLAGVLDWYITTESVTSELYEEFFHQCVLPHVQPFPGPHSVVVLDQASTHMRQRLRRAVERLGGHVLFLAPHCPMDNPEEYLNGWLKGWLKRHSKEAEYAHLSNPELVHEALQQVPPNAARGWFIDAGY